MSQDTQLSAWLAHLAAAVQATPRSSERSRNRASTCVGEPVESEGAATSCTACEGSKSETSPSPLVRRTNHRVQQVPCGAGATTWPRLPQCPARVEPGGVRAKCRRADVRRDGDPAKRPGIGSHTV